MPPLTRAAAAARNSKAKKEPTTSNGSNLSPTTSSSSMSDDSGVRGINEKRKTGSIFTNYSIKIPYKICLPLLVMLDMVGVSLVVPLLHSQYFQLAGVVDATQREWLSSVFSVSQILGGLVFGALSDSQQWISKRAILCISFAGSAFAYAMILEGGLLAILISRVTVGLVKQTMTVTTSMMAHATDGKERAIHVGRLNASVTVAFIVGPSAGAYLFSHVGTYAPIYVSCTLFIINMILVAFCLAPENSAEKDNDSDDDDGQSKASRSKTSQAQSQIDRIVSNFKSCFNPDDPCLMAVVSAMLLFQWVHRTTDYKNIATYYEMRYGTEPYQRGYLQSYQSALTFVVQSSLIQPILHVVSGEVNAAVGASLLMAMATFLEIRCNFLFYLLVLCPLRAIAVALLGICLKSIVSQVAPNDTLGSVFATIDILQNAAQVTVPFYRTTLFGFTQPNDVSIVNSTAHGDPDPYRWLTASGIHWVLASVALAYLLWKGNPCEDMHEEENDDDDDDNDINPLARGKLKTN